MRIPDQLLKSVGFVSRDQENFDYRASAFVVSVPHDERTGYLHLVTAKHVAISIQTGQAVVAMNGKDGKPLWMQKGADVPWFFHPDENVDLAILPMASLRLREYDYQNISTNMFVTPTIRAERGIGIGDEVLTIGLFPDFLGAYHFTPMVRSGVLAMMPDGRITHPDFGSMEAFLIGSRSIGGLSGSPVFVRDTLLVDGLATSDGAPQPFFATGGLHLLGLLSGHWEKRSGQSEANINMGISIVVPAAKIPEASLSSELVELREQALARGLLP